VGQLRVVFIAKLTLLVLFKGIVAIGKDVERRGSKQVRSILIDQMTLAGN